MTRLGRIFLASPTAREHEVEMSKGRLLIDGEVVRVSCFPSHSFCYKCRLSSLRNREKTTLMFDPWIMIVHLKHHLKVGDLSSEELERVRSYYGGF